jgi:hypothetical protein
MSILSKAFGDEFTPKGTEAQTAEITAALQKYLPQLTKAQTDQLTPIAQAQLDAAKSTTPGYNDLAIGELGRLQPQVSAVQGAYDAGQAQNDVANLRSYGVPAAEALRATDAAANPEYYSNLSALGGKYGEALGALSPGLSAGERAEIERGSSRLNASGADASAVNLAEKAGLFGAGATQKANNFASAITNISSALPALKTGLNPIDTALGRDSRSSPVAGAVSPVVKPDSTAFSLGGNTLNKLFGTANQNNALAAGAFKSWGDALEQDSRSFSNIASGVGSIAGA